MSERVDITEGKKIHHFKILRFIEYSFSNCKHLCNLVVTLSNYYDTHWEDYRSTKRNHNICFSFFLLHIFKAPDYFKARNSFRKNPM